MFLLKLINNYRVNFQKSMVIRNDMVTNGNWDSSMDNPYC